MPHKKELGQEFLKTVRPGEHLLRQLTDRSALDHPGRGREERSEKGHQGCPPQRLAWTWVPSVRKSHGPWGPEAQDSCPLGKWTSAVGCQQREGLAYKKLKERNTRFLSVSGEHIVGKSLFSRELTRVGSAHRQCWSGNQHVPSRRTQGQPCKGHFTPGPLPPAHPYKPTTGAKTRAGKKYARHTDISSHPQTLWGEEQGRRVER